jgi:hypothetical protein
MRRLVSFLGLGPLKSEPPHYTPTRYSWDGVISEETPLVERAILDLLGPFDSIVVLGTPEVKARWVDTGLLEEKLGTRPRFEDFRWSEGAEQWAIFSLVRRALSREADAGWCETEAPSEIVFDVTHGFRGQMLLGLAALNFTLSEWAQQAEAPTPSVRLVYGAFEAATDGVAPLWDLTQFVAVSQWNDAIQALVRFGRADDLERLGLRESQQLRAVVGRPVDVASQKRAGIAQRFGKLARQFADDLSLARFPALIESNRAGSVADLRAFLASADRAELVGQLPLLQTALSRLDAMVKPLQADRLESTAGLTALTHLAELYQRLHRFSEQVAVVREAAITAVGVATGRSPVPQVGTNGYAAARDGLEEFAKELGRARQGVFKAFGGDVERKAQLRAMLEGRALAPSDQLLGGLELFAGAFKPRNDIHHGGLGEGPSGASTLRTKLEEVTRAFVALVR